MGRAKKRKIYRSHCANPTCQKRFRHADKAAKTCSERCRKAVYRARRKAREEAETDAEMEPHFHSGIRRSGLRNRKPKRQAAEAKRQVATREAENATDRHPEPAPPEPRRRRRKRNVGGLGGLASKPDPLREVVIPLPRPNADSDDSALHKTGMICPTLCIEPHTYG